MKGNSKSKKILKTTNPKISHENLYKKYKSQELYGEFKLITKQLKNNLLNNQFGSPLKVSPTNKSNLKKTSIKKTNNNDSAYTSMKIISPNSIITNIFSNKTSYKKKPEGKNLSNNKLNKILENTFDLEEINEENKIIKNENILKKEIFRNDNKNFYTNSICEGTSESFLEKGENLINCIPINFVRQEDNKLLENKSSKKFNIININSEKNFDTRININNYIEKNLNNNKIFPRKPYEDIQNQENSFYNNTNKITSINSENKYQNFISEENFSNFLYEKLFLSSKKGDKELFLDLISELYKIEENQIDLHRKNEEGKTFLHISCEEGNLKILEILIKMKVDINIKTLKEKKTSLHLSSEKGYFDISKILIENGASLILVDQDENTPLHYCSLYGHCELLKFFLEKNENYELKNKFGKTPLDLACDTKIKEILLNFSFKNKNLISTKKKEKSNKNLTEIKNFSNKNIKNNNLTNFFHRENTISYSQFSDYKSNFKFYRNNLNEKKNTTNITKNVINTVVKTVLVKTNYEKIKKLSNPQLENNSSNSSNSTTKKTKKVDFSISSKSINSISENSKNRKIKSLSNLSEENIENDKNFYDSSAYMSNLNEDQKIGPHSFDCHALLGRGSFGEVYLVEEKSIKRLFAMKILSKEIIMGNF